jgi:flavin-dependent dehydrogenase
MCGASVAFPRHRFPRKGRRHILGVVVDVEIVGASFAGLACARTTASRGLRTVVWERKRDPGDAVRTTGLLVKEAAEEEDFPTELVRRIHGVRLYGPSLRWIDLDAPGYYFLATDTPALLRSMADRARTAGAEVRCGRAFDVAERSARVLVGADGPRSGVARHAGLGTNRRFLAGVEAELEGAVDLEERLHVFLDPELAPGYIGWVVPGLGLTQVGLAARGPARPDLDRFIERVKAVVDLSSTSRVGTRGGLIPVGGTVRPFATRDTVLVGDAAGLVSPLTAGGIHTALRSGRAAGLAIASYLLDGGPALDRALTRVYPSFRGKLPMRAVMDLHPPNALIDLALGSPWFRALAQAIFFHHRGLLSGEAWRDLGPALVSASRSQPTR